MSIDQLWADFRFRTAATEFAKALRKDEALAKFKLETLLRVASDLQGVPLPAAPAASPRPALPAAPAGWDPKRPDIPNPPRAQVAQERADYIRKQMGATPVGGQFRCVLTEEMDPQETNELMELIDNPFKQLSHEAFGGNALGADGSKFRGWPTQMVRNV